MKIITRQKDLLLEFKRLAGQYNQFYLAGLNSDILAEVMPKEHKIKKVIIGIEFYKIHPDIITNYLENKNIRFT